MIFCVECKISLAFDQQSHQFKHTYVCIYVYICFCEKYIQIQIYIKLPNKMNIQYSNTFIQL